MEMGIVVKIHVPIQWWPEVASVAQWWPNPHLTKKRKGKCRLAGWGGEGADIWCSLLNSIRVGGGGWKVGLVLLTSPYTHSE